MSVTPPSINKGTALVLAKTQGLATDQFLYFFLRLRKGEIRRVVEDRKSVV